MSPLKTIASERRGQKTPSFSLPLLPIAIVLVSGSDQAFFSLLFFGWKIGDWGEG